MVMNLDIDGMSIDGLKNVIKVLIESYNNGFDYQKIQSEKLWEKIKSLEFHKNYLIEDNRKILIRIDQLSYELDTIKEWTIKISNTLSGLHKELQPLVSKDIGRIVKN